MVTISDDILKSANISGDDLIKELAVYLYAKNKLSFGQAQHLAGVNVIEFQRLLHDSDVPLNYGISDLEDDIKALGLDKK